MSHIHWLIWAYERIEPGTGNYIENTQIDIVTTSLELALDKAKRLVPGKAGYVVRSVIEHLDGACTGHDQH